MILKLMPQNPAFVQYLGDGPMIMEKVVHIPNLNLRSDLDFILTIDKVHLQLH